MSTTESKALNGVRVVSLAINLPGPLAASRLAEMGASVTKVEPPSGDPLRAVVPGWYAELVGDQEVVELDLKSTAGRAEFEARLASADVLLTSMRPSALDRLGLADSAERYGLVLIEIVGYAGERADEGGHDLTYQAVQGTVLPPAMPLVPTVDLLGSERAVSATLAALMLRAASGAGVRRRVVLEDAAIVASASVRHGLTGPGDVLGGALPSYGIYAASDGHVAVGAVEPHFAERLAVHVGATKGELTAAFAAQGTTHWEDLGRHHDIPIVAVRDPRER
ncbi:MAG: CoA transferase [Rhodococcus sp.]|nr:CoA transferase [Rhodococcus sp. (in: high G+C Gram-positive bacteria)]